MATENINEKKTATARRGGVRIASATHTRRRAVAAKTVKEAEVPAQAEPVAMSDKKKILFVASECTPFIQTGGLAEVIGSLSKALAATGKFDVRVVVPMYSDINGNINSSSITSATFTFPSRGGTSTAEFSHMKRTGLLSISSTTSSISNVPAATATSTTEKDLRSSRAACSR